VLVLHFITSLHDGGAQTSLCKLIEASDSKHVVVNLSQKGKYSSILSRNCSVIDLSCTWYNLPFSLIHVLFLAFKLKPSVLSSWLYHADTFAFIVSCILRIPVVWNIRNNSVAHSKLSTRLLVLVNASLSSHISFVTFNSSLSRNTHRALGYSPKGSTVIHNGFDIGDNLPVNPQISTIDLQIGFAARWDPVKNHRKLLKAFKRFNKLYPNSRLHLAGLGMNSDNKALSETLLSYSIVDCVILYDSVDDIQSFYRKLSLHILPSFSEAFPNTLYESVLCGTPNIYSCTIDSNITPPGITPFRPESSVSIYEALKHFHDLPTSDRLQILTEQQTFIKSSFPLTRFVSSYESVFKQIS
jgi:glycosyltransferase involved in cell wall biosynthesis